MSIKAIIFYQMLINLALFFYCWWLEKRTSQIIKLLIMHIFDPSKIELFKKTLKFGEKIADVKPTTTKE